MSGTKWRAKGLLFENCNCQLVCPAHISFKQLCTHERCIGHWSVHIEEGRFGDVVLDGLNAVIFYESPRHMISGEWTELFYVDSAAIPNPSRPPFRTSKSAAIRLQGR